MPKNGHTHNNNSAANAAELLLCVWPFLDIRHKMVKSNVNVSDVCDWTKISSQVLSSNI